MIRQCVPVSLDFHTERFIPIPSGVAMSFAFIATLVFGDAALIVLVFDYDEGSKKK